MKKASPSKRRFLWKPALIILLALPLLAAAGLELLARASTDTCAGDNPPSISIPVCQDLERYPPDPERIALLAGLADEYARTGVLSEAARRTAFEQVVVEVALEEINALGVYCNGMLYVLADLPPRAKDYVRQHELYHALRPDLNETQVNWAAARDYPLGLVSNVFFAVRVSRGHYPSFACYLTALWLTFKFYFLG